MVAVLALSNDFALPINATYQSGPPGSTFAEPVNLFNTPVGLTIGIFLGLSALAHFIVASTQFFPRYSAGIAANRNFGPSICLRNRSIYLPAIQFIRTRAMVAI